ncbi:hypothetical protein SAMN04487905_11577 [Actinopolyspora xinjiangensis]|uniref:Uncharacterized protein n=1 Tax=Actinopolyspora xinjiangensis TaxID=405564 RepID=A0A1H0WUB6_9ACTN|nr:DUF6221 family protein [Actinopolyspora xinjiangensis]SDP94035.1 hypothetical protein SAMN04487905_11577 [Actinopolyspora xinjiangensis]
MDRLREFLRTQIPHDLAGTDTCSTTHITRGFRECELKAKILDQHRHCGTGHGPRDILNTSSPPRGRTRMPHRARLGLPYNDRPAYHHRWRP